MPTQSRLAMVVLSLLSLAVCSVSARQFRQFTPIAAPQSARQPDMPEGARLIENAEPLTRQQIEPLVQEVLSKWNTSEMIDTLSDKFFDSARLTDAVDSIVPRDAKLRLQSVQGVQTLQQYEIPGQSGERGTMVTVVSATVRTQLEFNSASTGFVRLPGTNEFILEVRSAAPPVSP